MINAAMRRSAVETFPAGVPLTVVAPPRAGFATIVAERGDAATVLCELDAVAAGAALDPATPHLLIEGLDDLASPVAFLAGLLSRTPQARIFALVSNAAHLGSLGAFFAGTPLAGEHPLVPEEIAPLFGAAGWRVLAIKSLIDEAIPPAASLPFAVTAGGIVFNLVEPAMLERCRNAAFLIIADPA